MKANLSSSFISFDFLFLFPFFFFFLIPFSLSRAREISSAISEFGQRGFWERIQTRNISFFFILFLLYFYSTFRKIRFNRFSSIPFPGIEPWNSGRRVVIIRSVFQVGIYMGKPSYKGRGYARYGIGVHIGAETDDPQPTFSDLSVPASESITSIFLCMGLKGFSQSLVFLLETSFKTD